jgi:hypothetical protein
MPQYCTSTSPPLIMRLANHAGRGTIITTNDHGIDVHAASGGKFGPDLAGLYERWEEFTAWVSLSDVEADVVVYRAFLLSPSPDTAAGVRYRFELFESREGVWFLPKTRHQLGCPGHQTLHRGSQPRIRRGPGVLAAISTPVGSKPITGLSSSYCPRRGRSRRLSRRQRGLKGRVAWKPRAVGQTASSRFRFLTNLLPAPALTHRLNM